MRCHESLVYCPAWKTEAKRKRHNRKGGAQEARAPLWARCTHNCAEHLANFAAGVIITSANCLMNSIRKSF